MKTSQILNSKQIRMVNRAAVLELVREEGPIARSVIGRKLGMSPPTVMRIVGQLLAENLVQLTGNTEGSIGGRRELLAYNKDGNLVIGVDLGGSKIYGALANIGGEVVREANSDGHATSGEACFELLVSLIEQLANVPLMNGQRLRGIAVGAPGITHVREGVVEWAPSLNWHDFPLKRRLEEQFELPIEVENDVNLAVLGESRFGVGRGARNMVLIALGTGVGAGIIIDGALCRGHSEAAGEIGYMVPTLSSLGRVYETFGALESIVSGAGVAQRARGKIRGTVTEGQLERLTAKDVFDAARRGEKWATSLVAETAGYLSLAIANISALLDPELIILGGGVSKSADLLIPAIIQGIKGVVPRLPRIEASILGSRATVMGAIVLTSNLIDDFFSVRTPL